jgi:hypothetical protein
VLVKILNVLLLLLELLLDCLEPSHPSVPLFMFSRISLPRGVRGMCVCVPLEIRVLNVLGALFLTNVQLLGRTLALGEGVTVPNC